jgi:hypothetical protein
MHTSHTLCVCDTVCDTVCGFLVTLCFTYYFDDDATVCMSKKTFKMSLTKTSLGDHDQRQLELFCPDDKD